MGQGFLRTALVLGLLSAIGPFAIDMYLPALPSIGRTWARRCMRCRPA
jgi:DHA1 family bicyclomycin/chloramphenicol resistance-like MFS transporter